ncbi:MAG: glycosyltransferase [Chlorogloeopsis fritschii C42_A2020_084]|uniref:glycosyltransferase n=1 Tax=Chlorogloeopsis fritschii TaxID=1124 RepID=UPI001A0B05A8|nr:glycosyltransferase [Chlorogloeopsis fritschii]MBF2004235.1 glycosyltransferase [Chlorogloeopsis fritschii C42_A2020_084]
MRVLHVIPSISPVRGGPSQAVLAMVKALQAYGVEAEIATTNDNGLSLLNVPLNQRTEYEQVPVWFLPRFSPPLKEFIFSTAITQWLWQYLRNYDIVHNHYIFSYAPTCAGAIARHLRVPYIVRTIGQLSPWALNQSRLKKQVYTFLIEKHNLNCAAAIHCTSASEAEDVRRFGIQTPTITLPLGVNQPSYMPDAKHKLRYLYGIPIETPTVLFLSRLHYKKRPDLLIRSLNLLAVQNYKFHLILAGTGEPDYVKYLKNLTVSLGLASRTSFVGFVMGNDKQLLLQGSDIFVLPSFSENFGIAVAEAMVAGLPVIITPGVQIAPEIAKANAGLIIEGEEDILANAIAQLLTSPNLRQKLGENGQSFANSQYSWSAIAQNLSTVYKSILRIS